MDRIETEEKKRGQTLLTLLIGFVMGMPACGPPAGDLPMPPVSTGEAMRHAVSNEQLREVMRRLKVVSFDRLPQEFDDPGRERVYLQEAGVYARDLALDAIRISAIVDQTGLAADRQDIFLGLAERLRTGASRLREQTDLGQTRRINTTMNEIDDTCNACHALFREEVPRLSP